MPSTIPPSPETRAMNAGMSWTAGPSGLPDKAKTRHPDRRVPSEPKRRTNTWRLISGVLDLWGWKNRLCENVRTVQRVEHKGVINFTFKRAPYTASDMALNPVDTRLKLCVLKADRNRPGNPTIPWWYPILEKCTDKLSTGVTLGLPRSTK